MRRGTLGERAPGAMAGGSRDTLEDCQRGSGPRDEGGAWPDVSDEAPWTLSAPLADMWLSVRKKGGRGGDGADIPMGDACRSGPAAIVPLATGPGLPLLPAAEAGVGADGRTGTVAGVAPALAGAVGGGVSAGVWGLPSLGLEARGVVGAVLGGVCHGVTFVADVWISPNNSFRDG